MSEPEPAGTAGPSPAGARWLVIALFGLMALVRLVHIDADPPPDLDWSGGVFFDEGMLAHNARDRVLFGHPPVDEWNDVFVSPVLSYLKWGTLRLLGVGIAQVRIIPIAFSLGILALVYFMAKHAGGWRFGLLTVSLLGFSYLFVMFNRLGLTETSVLFFMVLSAFLWLEGWGRFRRAGDPARLPGSSAAFFVAAGAATFLSYVWKSYPSFVPVPFATLAVLCRRDEQGGRAIEPRAALAAALALAAGVAIVLVPWYALFYVRYAAQIQHAMSFYERQSLPHDLHELAANLGDLSFFRVFFRDPVLLYLSFGFVGVLIHRFFHAPRRLEAFDVFFGLWYVAHFLFDAILSYTPVRYHVPVIPPMCVLAAHALTQGVRSRELRLPPRVGLASFPVLWLWLGCFLAHLPLSLQPIWEHLASDPTQPLPGTTKLAVWLAIAGLLLALDAVAGRRMRRRDLVIPATTALWLLGVAPLAYTGAVQARDYLKWALQPQYQIRDLSRDLGNRFGDAWMAGLAAPELGLENGMHTLHVYKDFFNDRDLFARFPISYLLLDSRQREQYFYYTTYPDAVRPAALLDAFPISYGNFFLLSLVEPELHDLRLDPIELGSSRFSAHATVANPARGLTRDVRVRWSLVPEPQPKAITPPVAVLGPESAPITLTAGTAVPLDLEGNLSAGPAHLVVFLEPPHRATIEARFFDHQTGILANDPRALDGLAWQSGAAKNRACYSTYGPYLKFGPGRIHAWFRLRAGVPEERGPLARIEIARPGGRGVLLSRNLGPAELPAGADYTTPELDYFHDQYESLEFRVFTFARSDLWVDQVTIEVSPGIWVDAALPAAPSSASH